MISFEDFLIQSYIKEDFEAPPNSGEAPSEPPGSGGSDQERWKSATGGADSYKQKQAFALLFEIARIGVRKYPNKILTWLKSLPDDEIQEKIKQLENEGLWNSIKGGAIDSEKDIQGDGLETIAPNSADGVGGGDQGGEE